jgi:hypothetical protein
MKDEFTRKSLENYSNINFMNIYAVRVERRTDGQTDVTKLIAAFRNFANAPEMNPYRISKTQFMCLDIIEKC